MSDAVSGRCCCAEHLQARAQAVVDQLVGFDTVGSALGIPLSAEAVRHHLAKVVAVLQAALDEYGENHASPSATCMTEAERFLAERM